MIATITISSMISGKTLSCFMIVLLRRQEPSLAPQALPLAAVWAPAFAGER